MTIRRRMLLALPTAVAAAALIGSPAVAATGALATGAPEHAAPAPASQGFIMSDGRICDPIRHIGC